MLGQCSHQFIWPRRAADGRYYQVCRICDAEYEFDWETMGRLRLGDTATTELADADTDFNTGTDPAERESGNTEWYMESQDTEAWDGDARSASSNESESSGAKLSVAELDVPELDVPELDVAETISKPAPPVATPRLSLLLESEPRHRVFIQNLTDLVLRRPLPTVKTTSAPAPFWDDVFIPAGLPWWGFAESVLAQMILVTAVLLLFQKLPASGPIEQRSAFDNSYISYYTPPKSFPALGSHSARPRTKAKRLIAPVHQPTIKVAADHAKRQGQGQEIAPPVIAAAGATRLKIGSSASPAPMMPLSATGRSNLTVPSGPTWIVAPPPDPRQLAARRAGAMQASAVAPAPEVAGVSSRGAGVMAMNASHPAVVGPAPSVAAAGSMRRPGDINIGEAAVVKPAPQLPMDAQGVASGLAKAGLGTAGVPVVPPPPSVLGGGSFSGRGRGFAVNGGSQAVPPAPSLKGAGSSAGSGRATSFSGAGAQVVPPPPSALGEGNGAGRGRGNSLSAGLQAVPPPPSLQGEGNGAGRGRGSSLSGEGLQAAPPASAGQGGNQAAGNAGAGGSSDGASKAETSGGGQSSGAGGSSQVAASNGSASSGSGKSGSGGNGSSNNGSDSDEPDPNEPATVEVPLHLIGPVLALPGSSYFSNYEVFIAERKLPKGHTQLIKLVYISLPYQRRLAEYGQSNWTVPKLRVTRDQSCDESLLQMTWPETDPRPDPQHAADSPALTAKDRKGMLPCYRTTADDYRRALSRNR